MKITIIGFSVTGFGEPSFIDLLRDQFKQSQHNIQIEFASFGGLSIDSLPFAIKGLVDLQNTDLVILEITTSWWNRSSPTLELTEKYLNLIIDQVQSEVPNISFLNLYREDTKDCDMVVDAIELASKRFGYPVLDLKKLEASNETIDGVHPTPAAIIQISNALYRFIIKYAYFFEKNIVNWRVKKPQISLQLVTPHFSSDQLTYQFNSKYGKKIDTVEMPQGYLASHFFKTPVKFSGVFFLYGPDTNFMHLQINNILYEIAAHDPMSFYRRIGFKRFDVENVECFTLSHPYENRQCQMSREPWESVTSLKNYIVGFAVS